MWRRKPEEKQPVDVHAECKQKRRVLVVYRDKKKTQMWAANAIEEFKNFVHICNEDSRAHQWVNASQIQELVPLQRDAEIEELEKMYDEKEERESE